MSDVANLDMNFLKEIGRDVLQNYDSYRTEGESQTIRRNLIRSECAYIEGSLWFLKKLVRSDIKSNKINVHWKTMLYLFEMDFTIKDSGEIKEQDKKLGTINNLKAFYKCSSNIYGYEIDFGSSGWADLKQTFQVRDRLMHPSSQKTIEVSDKEILTAINCHNWYEDTKMNLLEKVVKKYS